MQLNDLVKRAAEQGVGAIKDAFEPMIPFTLLSKQGVTADSTQVMVTRFASELPEQSLQQAQASLRPGSGVAMYALAWPGSVRIDGRAWDAVLIESGDAESEEAAIYAQCYELQISGLFRKRCRSVAVGEPVIADTCISRLWSPRTAVNQAQRDWEIW